MPERHPDIAATPSSTTGADGAAGPTRVDAAVRSITDYIHSHALKVGDRLPSESRFADSLGVSRTVVREAFKSLSAMRIIEMHAGRRAQVASFDGAAITLTLTHALRTEQLNAQQLWDARRAVELRTSALAALHRTEAQAGALLETVAQMRHTPDFNALTTQDIAFHVAIAEASRNPLFPVLVSALTSAMHETSPVVWRHRRDEAARLRVVQAHDDIARAIANREPEAASEAMGRHFDMAFQALVHAGFN